MAKNTPAFQFYPADFMGGIAFLDEEQTGVYIKLLCCLWIHGNSVPDDLGKLARAASIPPQVLEKAWPAIQDKFIVESGNVMHARFAKMMEISGIRRESGVNGGRPKKQNGNQNENQNKTKTESKSKASCRRLKNEERRLKTEVGSLETEDWNLPEGWDSPEVRKALDDWAAMRSRKNVPVRSRRSTSKIFKQFDSPQHLIKVCEICEANEWQGLKPEYWKENRSQETLTTAQKRERNMLKVRAEIEARSKNNEPSRICHDGN